MRLQTGRKRSLRETNVETDAIGLRDELISRCVMNLFQGTFDAMFDMT